MSKKMILYEVEEQLVVNPPFFTHSIPSSPEMVNLLTSKNKEGWNTLTCSTSTTYYGDLLFLSGSDKTQNGTERNGTNRGSRKLENLFVNSCTLFLIVIQ